MAAIAQKITRQLKNAVSVLPASGARIGETLKTSMVVAISRAASCPVCRSRMMARGITMAAQEPTPCRKRNAIRVSTLGAKLQPMPRKDEQPQAEIKRRLAAESVGQRPVDDLADGDREEEAHQAHLHGADIDLELAGDGRERRQVHVDGKGPDGGQHAEDERVAQKGGLHRKRLS